MEVERMNHPMPSPDSPAPHPHKARLWFAEHDSLARPGTGTYAGIFCPRGGRNL